MSALESSILKNPYRTIKGKRRSVHDVLDILREDQRRFENTLTELHEKADKSFLGTPNFNTYRITTWRPKTSEG